MSLRRRNVNKWKRPVLFATWMFVVSTALIACSNETVLRWEEEVTLSTGEKLLLDRTTRYRKKSAAFNPLESSWGPEDSSIVVREGPADLVGARFGLKEWFEPLVLDRDPASRQLLLIATGWNCDWVRPYAGKNRSIYVAFALQSGGGVAVNFPDWAWNRTRNLYLTYFDIKPPGRVSAEHAREHNASKARGSKFLFVIDPSFRAPDCPGESK
jgi:hypothetical protein